MPVWGVAVCCRGSWAVCGGVGGPPAAWRATAALALAVALWMWSAGRGGSEEEVEDVDEDEYEEEVVVLGDAGCAVTRAGAGLCAAAAPEAARAGRMEGMSSGRRLKADGWGGPAVTWQPGGPIWSAAVEEGGAGPRSPQFGLGWAGVLQCVRVCGMVSTGGNSSRGLHSGAGGVCAGGVCGSLGGVGVLWGMGLLGVGVCGLQDGGLG